MGNEKYFTFKEEDCYDEDCIISKISPRVAEEINMSLLDYRSELIGSLYDCESPIEQLMAVALVRILEPWFFERRNLDVVGVINQAEIVSDGKTYRVDMEIAVENKTTQKMHHFVIECDGHDFHEKNKTQVAKDKSRERALTKEGFVVIRFSGSEIYKSPGKCAFEVRDIMVRHCIEDG